MDSYTNKEAFWFSTVKYTTITLDEPTTTQRKSTTQVNPDMHTHIYSTKKTGPDIASRRFLVSVFTLKTSTQVLTYFSNKAALARLPLKTQIQMVFIYICI